MTQLISGHTRLVAHLGVPTESFKAPMIYNPYFEAAGIDAVVMPMGCEAEDFVILMHHLARLRNFAGALITMPHKIAAAEIADVASTTVKVCGAANALKRDAEGRLVADMFDGEGFVRGVLRKGREVRGRSALVVGAGGVGSAIAASLAGAGAARIGLYDPDTERCEGLATRIRDHHAGTEVVTGSSDPTGHDIVVNATPLGMNPGDPMPLEVERIAPEAFVGEVVMKVEATPFLAAARARGCETQVGTDMLFEQIPAYLEFFGFPSTTAEHLRQVARLRY
jgi:shikimate dehydrogenase